MTSTESPEKTSSAHSDLACGEVDEIAMLLQMREPAIHDIFCKMIHHLLLINTTDSHMVDELNEFLVQDKVHNVVSAVLQTWISSSDSNSTLNSIISFIKSIDSSLSDRLCALRNAAEKFNNGVDSSSSRNSTPSDQINPIIQVMVNNDESISDCVLNSEANLDTTMDAEEPEADLSTGKSSKLKRRVRFILCLIICTFTAWLGFDIAEISGASNSKTVEISQPHFEQVTTSYKYVNRRKGSPHLPQHRRKFYNDFISANLSGDFGTFDVVVDPQEFDTSYSCNEIQNLTLEIISTDSISNWISKCDNKSTKHLTLQGTFSVEQLRNILYSNLQYSLEEIVFKGSQICSEFHIPDANNACNHISSLYRLKTMTFLQVNCACEDLYRFLRLCVYYYTRFQLYITNTLIPHQGSAIALGELGIKSRNTIQFTNVTGVKPETRVRRVM